MQKLDQNPASQKFASSSTEIMYNNIDIAEFVRKGVKVKFQCSWGARMRLLAGGANADVIIRTKGGSVKAHRGVLGIMSPLFQETVWSSDPKRTVFFQVWSGVEALQLFLLLLYSEGEMPMEDFVMERHFLEVMEACRKFRVESRPALEATLVAAARRSITVDNCWRYHMSLSRYKIGDGILDECVEFMCNNFAQFLDSQGYSQACKKYPGPIAAVAKWWTRTLRSKIGDGFQLLYLEACRKFVEPTEVEPSAAAVRSLLTLENCWGFYIEMLKYNVDPQHPDQLMKECIYFIFRNFSQFLDSNGFYEAWKQYPGPVAAVTRQWAKFLTSKISDRIQMPQIQFPPRRT